MFREFIIVEVMLPDVSGEVAGVAQVNEWTGAVDDVDCRNFDFWCDRRDSPIVLDTQQRSLAQAIVQRTLEADSELTASREIYRGSAAAVQAEIATTMSAGETALADYLQNVREHAAEDALADSQVRRSG